MILEFDKERNFILLHLNNEMLGMELEDLCSGQVFPDTNLGCSAIAGGSPALKLCGRR